MSNSGSLLDVPAHGTRFYLPTLDGWRAISILAVMVYHASFYYFHVDGVTPEAATLQAFKLGSFGVQFFFGISGFLITARMIREEREDGGFNVGAFYLRRVFRILPILLVYLGVIFLLSATKRISVSGDEFLASIFFYRNYVRFDTWYLEHFWSLSFEEHFYIVWPLLFLFAPKARRGLQVAVLILAVTIWRKIEFKYAFIGPWLPGIYPNVRTDLYVDYILWGVLAAHLHADEGIRSRLKNVLRPWVPIASLFLFAIIYYVQVPLAATMRALLIQAAILSTVLHPASLPGRLLETRVLAFIGGLSYSLYVWQQLFFPSRSFIIFNWAVAQTLPLNVVFLLIVAWISNRAVERPMIKWGRSFTSRE